MAQTKNLIARGRKWANFARKKGNEMLKTLLAYLLVQSGANQLARGSGVLELELVDLQQLDSSEAPVRLNVCLREAFASQLEGPCAFGNATLTLGAAFRLAKPAAPAALALAANQSNAGDEQPPAQAHGSQMTNVLRIPFTFRWTKSFTIILAPERQAHEQPPAANSSGATNRTANQARPAPTFLPIERHVLTENEVLPCLETSSSKPWTARHSRSLKTSLVYRFRVLCSLNYYGDGCATFCRPRQDQFGHYQCSAMGQKLCSDGWQGADCERARCRPGCNEQHGFCDNQPNTCQCRPGWTGARCDECLTYPGCQNGFCLAPWQCVCQRNWGGFLCDQDLNYCAGHQPCENNATCQNVAPGRYKCHCPTGFTGLNCQHKLATLVDLASSMTQLSAGCALNPCLNGGACLALRSARLEANEIGADDQAAGRSPYRCLCPPGFAGDYCQWPEPLGQTNSSSSAVSYATSFSTSETSSSSSGPALEPPLTPTRPVIDMEPISVALEPADEARQAEQEAAGRQAAPAVEMRHLVSGVLIASAVGCFCAALLLAWCCLLAIQRNQLQLFQLNVIQRRHEPTPAAAHSTRASFSSSLRRMGAKIGDSLRRPRAATASIKPATKLSLANVLGAPGQPAPPSYEESNTLKSRPIACLSQLFAAGSAQASQEARDLAPTGAIPCDDSRERRATAPQGLVKRGALEQEIDEALRRKSAALGCDQQRQHQHGQQPLWSCPKHGRLYATPEGHDQLATTIEIEYHRPAQARPPDQNTGPAHGFE